MEFAKSLIWMLDGAQALVAGVKLAVDAVSTTVEVLNNIYASIPAPAKAAFIVAATTLAVASGVAPVAAATTLATGALSGGVMNARFYAVSNMITGNKTDPAGLYNAFVEGAFDGMVGASVGLAAQGLYNIGTHPEVFKANVESFSNRVAAKAEKIAERTKVFQGKVKNDYAPRFKEFAKDEAGESDVFGRFVDWSINKAKSAANKVKSKFCNGKLIEENTYYHVTSAENEKKIMESGVLGRRGNAWESKVFAWRVQPTKSQASIAGISSDYNTVLKFKTTASFSLDRGNRGKKIADIVVESSDGQRVPIQITDVEDVGYRKEFWEIWKK